MSTPPKDRTAAERVEPEPAAVSPATDAEVALETGPPGRLTARRRSAILRRLLALCDLASVACGLGVAFVFGPNAFPSTFFWAAMFSPVWVVVAKLDGLYDHDHRRIRHSTVDELPGLLTTSVLASLFIALLVKLSPAPPLETASAIIFATTAFVASFFLRAGARHLFRRLIHPQLGLLVGPAPAAAALARKLAVHPEASLGIAGYLAAERGEAQEAERLEYLGRPEDLVPVAVRLGIERILVVEGGLSHPQLGQVLDSSKRIGLGLTIVPQHSSLLGPGTELNRLGELPLLDFRFADPSRSTMLMKRILDVLVSAAVLLVLSPLLILIAILIKLDSKGPVLFRQVRIGQNGRPFKMLKFRSMVVDAEQRLSELVDLERLDEPVFKIPDDPRVTRVGRQMRRFSLDELPQLINVLRGDMSLVGPRPEEEAVVNLYDERQRARLSIKPGVTGPMQVYGRGDLSFEERLALERDYMDNLSITGDIAILLRTPRAIMRGEGAY